MLERDALDFLISVTRSGKNGLEMSETIRARSPQHQTAGMGVGVVVVGFDRPADGIPGGGRRPIRGC